MTTSSASEIMIDEPTPVGKATVRAALLCVANFPANTGYAWEFIESLYRSLAEHLATRDVATIVAYPAISEAPRTLAGSAARAVELEIVLGSPRSLLRMLSFVRRNHVRVLYLTDRATWHPAYAVLRLAGVRHIVVHDHTSGSRTSPTGWKRRLKQWRLGIPGALADRVVAVSDYVATRKREVDLVPASRISRIWNARPDPERKPDARARLIEALALEPGPIVACACRATPEKGVAPLLRAFDRYCGSLTRSEDAPTLVYFGDGPAFPALQGLRQNLAAASRIVMAGYRTDALELIGGADICVVPSLWQEAFGLAALEPMMYGIPVIASRVGGIPEVVVDGETGLLVEPGDEAALEAALRSLLSRPSERERLGRNGLLRARTQFRYDSAVAALIRLFEAGFGLTPV